MSDLRKVIGIIGIGITVASLIIENRELIEEQIRKLIKWVRENFIAQNAVVEIPNRYKRRVEALEDNDEIEAFLCPISKTLIEDPVITPYGHVYDRENIERWLSEHDFCPITMKKLRRSDLKVCYTMKCAIEQYKILKRSLNRN